MYFVNHEFKCHLYTVCNKRICYTVSLENERPLHRESLQTPETREPFNCKRGICTVRWLEEEDPSLWSFDRKSGSEHSQRDKKSSSLLSPPPSSNQDFLADCPPLTPPPPCFSSGVPSPSNSDNLDDEDESARCAQDHEDRRRPKEDRPT